MACLTSGRASGVGSRSLTRATLSGPVAVGPCELRREQVVVETGDVLNGGLHHRGIPGECGQRRRGRRSEVDAAGVPARCGRTRGRVPRGRPPARHDSTQEREHAPQQPPDAQRAALCSNHSPRVMAASPADDAGANGNPAPGSPGRRATTVRPHAGPDAGRPTHDHPPVRSRRAVPRAQGDRHRHRHGP